MRTKARANQGGSIVSFVVVGTLLLAGLGGGVYYVSQRDGGNGEQQAGQAAESDQDQVAQAPASNDTEAEDRNETQNPNEATDNSDALNLNNNDDRQDEASEEPANGGVTEPEDRQEEAPSTSAPAEESEAPEQIASTGGPTTTQAELPQTGPAEALIGAVALAAITFVAVMFRRSRQDLAEEINRPL